MKDCISISALKMCAICEHRSAVLCKILCWVLSGGDSVMSKTEFPFGHFIIHKSVT